MLKDIILKFLLVLSKLAIVKLRFVPFDGCNFISEICIVATAFRIGDKFDEIAQLDTNILKIFYPGTFQKIVVLNLLDKFPLGCDGRNGGKTRLFSDLLFQVVFCSVAWFSSKHCKLNLIEQHVKSYSRNVVLGGRNERGDMFGDLQSVFMGQAGKIAVLLIFVNDFQVLFDGKIITVKRFNL